MTPSEHQVWRGRTESAEETQALGALLAKHVQPGDVIGLIGELGTGKTQLVRALATVLATEEAAVSSPTFVMIHEYPARQGRPVLVHIDAYRLSSLEDLESIGGTPGSDRGFSEDLLRNAVLVIEWADRLDGMVGNPLLEVHLTHESEHQRGVVITAPGSWSKRWPGLLRSLESLGRREDTSTTKTDDTHRPCVVCETPVDVRSKSFPFCSDRCRMIDLGKWIDGNYVISRPVDESDLEET